MDVEKTKREELMSGLKAHFFCFEEVLIETGLLPKIRVRADVVAVPCVTHATIEAIAFEVKSSLNEHNYSGWSDAVHQASNYVYGTICGNVPREYLGRRINSAFTYPSPQYHSDFRNLQDRNSTDSADALLTSGIFFGALRFRVGRAFWSGKGDYQKLELAFGPNDVWNSRDGFVKRGEGLFSAKRQVGSANRKIDIFEELRKRV